MSRQQRRAEDRTRIKAERRRATLTTGALATGMLLAAGPAAAATITVNSKLDVGADDGLCTLREAVASANSDTSSGALPGECGAGDPGADTIVFAPSVTGTITLTDGEIPIYNSLTINGPGAATLTVSGNNASRIFNVYNSPSPPLDVTITGLTLTSGLASGSQGGGAIQSDAANLTLDHVVITGNVAQCCGGGVYFSGYYYTDVTLTITNSTISGNTAINGSGGGVYAYYLYGSASVYLKNNTITGNQAGAAGGGVGVYLYGGDFTMKNTVVSNNTAGTRDAAEGFGGGVSVEGCGCSEVLIEDSVITGNVADPQDAAAVLSDLNDLGHGGGLALSSVTGTVRRTTISGNTAFHGGGVHLTYGATVTFENVTIANNAAKSPAFSGAGGGVYIEYGGDPTFGTFNESTITGNSAQAGSGGLALSSYGAYATLDNSIVANNTVGPPSDTPDVNSYSGNVTASFTLIKTLGSATITDNGGNIVGADPLLGPLAANGSTVVAGAPGSTQSPFTQLPQCDSPVINAGDPAFVSPPATDERGRPRVSGGRIDMGATEFQPSAVDFTVAAQSVNENAGSVTVTVARTGSDGAITATYATVDGTAKGTASGVGTPDYTPQNGQLAWGNGDTANRSFSVPILDDIVLEGNENFTVTLGAPACSPTPLAITTQTITILDNVIAATADVTLTKTADGQFVPGAPATYTITVTNHGPGAANSVVVTDVLPSGVTFVSATASQGSCSGTTTVTCNLGTIANGASATITLTVTPNVEGSLSNTATAAAAQSDPNPDDNASTADTVVEANAIPTLHGSLKVLLAALMGALGLATLRRRFVRAR